MWSALCVVGFDPLCFGVPPDQGSRNKERRPHQVELLFHSERPVVEERRNGTTDAQVIRGL